MKLTVGADPEIFIRDLTTDKLISAHGLFPGTKEEPYKVTHGAVQVDGMAAEYNILPASDSVEFAFYNISVLRDLRNLIQELNPDLEFEFVFEPVADFGAEYIAEQPLEARRLGCTPDFNAWEGGAVNPTPDADMPFRTASGHIHIGWTENQDINDPEFIEAYCMMAKQMDCYVAPNTLHWEGKEGHRRRELYGKAGAFRPKSYGVEYRTSSNSWLKSAEAMERVFLQTREAFEALLTGTRAYDVWCRKIREAINLRDEDYLGYNVIWSYPVRNDVNMDTLDKLYNKYEALYEKAKNVPVARARFNEEDPGPEGFDEFEFEDEFDDEIIIEPEFDDQPVVALGNAVQWAWIDEPKLP